MSSSENTGANQAPKGFEALKSHIRTHKIDVGLWCTRVLTILCTFTYFIPIFGNPINAYYKALIANAATSALRLHQRQPRMTPSREFLFAVFMEDSCHYLIYSLIFLYVSPFTLVLVPIFLFSLIHFASYSLTLLDTIGRNSWWGARLLISLVELQSRKILSLIALTEILLMPFSIILLFLSRAGLLTPFFYYQFLVMRYKSHRNPYTKNMFHELRLILDDFSAKPNTPSFLKTGIKSLIQFVSRCAPITSEATAAN
ncbi:Krueppel homolog 2 [Halyomorpha halys]|uniref:Krueppel homolog 2 n=1 Tax=Halyomorpha halys TaxID=286706 RepID=UPI0006D4D9D4|nr:Krueppel homolog 2 [Halyomorpha halys]